MFELLTLIPQNHQPHRTSGVSWTKGFESHHSQLLPSGLVLLTEDGFYSQGNRDRVRLTWFRLSGDRYHKVRTFEAMARLDDLPPKVDGNSVSLKTVDEAHAFMVSAGDDTFSQESTWKIQQGVPRLVSHRVLASRLRVVDAAIWHAWTAKHPSSLQRQMRQAWPEPDDLLSWSEKQSGSKWLIQVDRELLFTLQRGGAGQWKVTGLRLAHKKG